MRYFLFTDIHGNLEALLPVLEFAQKKNIDHYICLGDLVGYGASANEVIDKVLALKSLSIIRGNHDKAVCSLDSVQTFNPIAAAAIHWTKKSITKKNLHYLTNLKQGPNIIHDDIMICHGAPFDEDHYIFGEFDAKEAFSHTTTSLCFFGHTHFPFVYTQNNRLIDGAFIQGSSNEVKIEKDIKYLINPGSVGQPRDRNNRAACAIYDSDSKTVKFFRFDYDIKGAQKKIKDADLPPALAERLRIGI
jgi:predicted phosphodiesterase